MRSGTSASPGLADAARRLIGSLQATLHERAELLSVELHEEKFRLIQIFIWISAALFSGMLALTFASITLVYIFWDTARLAVLCSLTGVYLAALVFTATSFKRYLARQPKPFAATVDELQQDRATTRLES